jgi:hypothetical protein
MEELKHKLTLDQYFTVVALTQALDGLDEQERLNEEAVLIRKVCEAFKREIGDVLDDSDIEFVGTIYDACQWLREWEADSIKPIPPLLSGGCKAADAVMAELHSYSVIADGYARAYGVGLDKAYDTPYFTVLDYMKTANRTTIAEVLRANQTYMEIKSKR